MNMKKPLNMNKENMQLICLWPSCNKEAIKEITAYSFTKYNATVYYTIDIFLTFSEFNQLIYELYHSETWMIKENQIHLNSLLRKATWCYSKKKPITMILLSLPSPNTLLALKEEIRQKVGFGKHSIHTIENTQEAVYIWSRYAYSSFDFPLSHSFRKSIRWNFFRLYNYLRVTLFRLIGYIEQ